MKDAKPLARLNSTTDKTNIKRKKMAGDRERKRERKREHCAILFASPLQNHILKKHWNTHQRETDLAEISNEKKYMHKMH